jgi:hypothetical protein
MEEKGLVAFLIKTERKSAEQILKEHPSILEDYRAGLSQSKLVEKYKLVGKYPGCKNKNMARVCVSFVIANGLTEDERFKLAEKIHKSIGAKVGAELYGKKKGFFKYTQSQRIKENLNALKKRGCMPITNYEKRMIYAMGNDYRFTKKDNNDLRRDGKPDYKKIQTFLRDYLNYNRNIHSIRIIYSREKIKRANQPKAIKP